MSYMRGDNYIWSDGERLHLWIADGYDSWDEAVWAVDEEEKRREDRLGASGVGVPEAVMDEFVMMRVAQIVERGQVEEVIDRAVACWEGNFGCEALVKSAEKLKAALKQIAPEVEA